MAMSGTPSPWRFIPLTSCLAVAIRRCFVRRILETAELTTLERVGEIIAVCQKPVKLGKARKVTAGPFRIPFQPLELVAAPSREVPHSNELLPKSQGDLAEKIGV
jgi:hypothetical protein